MYYFLVLADFIPRTNLMIAQEVCWVQAKRCAALLVDCIFAIAFFGMGQEQQDLANKRIDWPTGDRRRRKRRENENFFFCSRHGTYKVALLQ